MFRDEEDPFARVLGDELRAGEVLVGQLRILGLVLVVAPSLIRILGYGMREYLPWGVVQWGVFMGYSLGVALVLRRGWYRPAAGYVTLALDLGGLVFSMGLFSLFTPGYGGVFADSLFPVYYLIALSAALRFDYRYCVFCVAASGVFILGQTCFDLRVHGIGPDLYVLGERLTVLVAVTGFSMVLTRRFRREVVSGYQAMARRVREISAILKIGRDILGRGGLESKLDGILGETTSLLQATAGMIGILDGDDAGFAHLVTRGPEVAICGTSSLEAVARDGDPLRNDGPERAVLGAPVMVDGQPAGALVVMREQAFSHEEEILLNTLAEQVALSLVHVRLFTALQDESTVQPITADDEAELFEGLIGRSPQMRQVCRLIDKAAAADIPVLIRGESGTGKELVAAALHRRSARRQGPFIKINCAAIPEPLLESELFGHERGAFTGAERARRGKFELADHGTVFLDEIGDMSPTLQVKLLRVIQERRFERVGSEQTREVDVRIISATNQDLEDRITRGLFREDLFYRVNGLPIHIPPLRQRREDIPLLVQSFLEHYGHERGVRLSRSAVNILSAREWRGNVRELENLIQRLLVVSEGDVLGARDILALDTDDHNGGPTLLSHYVDAALLQDFNLSDEVARCEKEFIQKALLLSDGNIREASRRLNIPKSTLFNKITKYQLKG